MKRIITIEVDDSTSKRLQKNPDKQLKRIMKLIGDQLSWGDDTRPVQDDKGVTVGRWSLRIEQDQPVTP